MNKYNKQRITAGALARRLLDHGEGSVCACAYALQCTLGTCRMYLVDKLGPPDLSGSAGSQRNDRWITGAASDRQVGYHEDEVAHALTLPSCGLAGRSA